MCGGAVLGTAVVNSVLGCVIVVGCVVGIGRSVCGEPGCRTDVVTGF